MSWGMGVGGGGRALGSHISRQSEAVRQWQVSGINVGTLKDRHKNGIDGWLTPRFKSDAIIVGLESTLSPSLISRKVAVSRQLISYDRSTRVSL
jgi:hypothetical protein